MEEKHITLIENSLDWHVVTYNDNSWELKHSSFLTSILQCGEAKEKFGIAHIQQCWDGEDYGEEAVYPF